MRTIYLFRHGRPEFPEGVSICIGVTPDLPLSAEGFASSGVWREFLKEKKISAFYSSPAQRCRQTAETISAGHWPIRIVPDLHEMSYGVWEGMRFEDIRAQYADLYARRGIDMTLAPPEGENADAVAVRGEQALRALLERTEGDVAVVAHAGLNRALLWKISGLPKSEIGRFHQDYVHLNILRFQDGKFSIDAVNQSLEQLT